MLVYMGGLGRPGPPKYMSLNHNCPVKETRGDEALPLYYRPHLEPASRTPYAQASKVQMWREKSRRLWLKGCRGSFGLLECYSMRFTCDDLVQHYKATVSPPPCFKVAAGKPNSFKVGQKSLHLDLRVSRRIGQHDSVTPG